MVLSTGSDEEIAQDMEDFLAANGGAQSLTAEHIKLEADIAELGGDEGLSHDPETKLAELITGAPSHNAAVEKFAHMTGGGMNRGISAQDMGGVSKVDVMKELMNKKPDNQKYPLLAKLISGLSRLKSKIMSKLRGRSGSYDLEPLPKKDPVLEKIGELQQKVESHLEQAMDRREAREKEAKTGIHQEVFDEFFPAKEKGEIQRRGSFTGSPSDRELEQPSRRRSNSLSANFKPDNIASSAPAKEAKPGLSIKERMLQGAETLNDSLGGMNKGIDAQVPVEKAGMSEDKMERKGRLAVLMKKHGKSAAAKELERQSKSGNGAKER
jgi:hypothetical protein